ncbi:hypothetical protein ACQKNX_22780 [Lysinibacillus sp. NPDC093712]|uniref:hypothetical protein n=1 Tax=Lysinibacillus sp. NPDC093712 TaxID=3390579 RepID=UPI003CFF5710
MFWKLRYRYKQHKTDIEILNKLPIFEPYLKMRDLKAFRSWDIYLTINNIKEMILATSLNDKDLELLYDILYERSEEIEALIVYISIHLPEERKSNKQYKEIEEWWFYYNLCYNDITKGLFAKITIFLEQCRIQRFNSLHQDWENEYPKKISKLNRKEEVN